MKRIVPVLLSIAVLVSCGKDASPYMTPEAIAAVDHFCGEYQIISMELSDGVIDLDGDGHSSIDLMDEMSRTGWLGYSSPFEELLSLVDPKTKKDQKAQIILYFPSGACEGKPFCPQTVSMNNIQFFYEVDDQGVITAPSGEFFFIGNDREYSSIKNLSLSILDDWNFVVCGTIDLYDRSLASHVKRTVHTTYHCVSTKEKSKR